MKFKYLSTYDKNPPKNNFGGFIYFQNILNKI